MTPPNALRIARYSHGRKFHPPFAQCQRRRFKLTATPKFSQEISARPSRRLLRIAPKFTLLPAISAETKTCAWPIVIDGFACLEARPRAATAGFVVPMKKVFTLLLAGGEGSWLFPLTKYRAKPAVPFGGIHRLIDFTLSNCVNSNMRRIGVLMQTKSTSLNRHLHLAWNVYRPELDEYIFPIHPALSTEGDVFKGMADAVHQNLRMIGNDITEVLIVSGDHIYKMDYSKMLMHHRDSGADVTVGSSRPTAPAPVSLASSRRTRPDASWRLRKSRRNPSPRREIPRSPSRRWGSIFSTTSC